MVKMASKNAGGRAMYMVRGFELVGNGNGDASPQVDRQRKISLKLERSFDQLEGLSLSCSE